MSADIDEDRSRRPRSLEQLLALVRPLIPTVFPNHLPNVPWAERTWSWDTRKRPPYETFLDAFAAICSSHPDSHSASVALELQEHRSILHIATCKPPTPEFKLFASKCPAEFRKVCAAYDGCDSDIKSAETAFAYTVHRACVFKTRRMLREPKALQIIKDIATLPDTTLGRLFQNHLNEFTHEILCGVDPYQVQPLGWQVWLDMQDRQCAESLLTLVGATRLLEDLCLPSVAVHHLLYALGRMIKSGNLPEDWCIRYPDDDSSTVGTPPPHPSSSDSSGSIAASATTGLTPSSISDSVTGDGDMRLDWVKEYVPSVPIRQDLFAGTDPVPSNQVHPGCHHPEAKMLQYVVEHDIWIEPYLGVPGRPVCFACYALVRAVNSTMKGGFSMVPRYRLWACATEEPFPLSLPRMREDIEDALVSHLTYDLVSLVIGRLVVLAMADNTKRMLASQKAVVDAGG
ncbi:hypothetical protein OH76DRAFT_44515 [Lentinus brumalis]|uniref:Uncharacterized protein n=1 Tax=Lentinus brumalis TaxID=2498619 RepID=A0A371DY78_9APHY|nr:hypothetical protein OH76DRAFT_44515 [Polyporus brumalis]